MIVCPYAKNVPEPRVVDALPDETHFFQLYDDADAYHKCLSAAWSWAWFQGDLVIVVEHDVVIRPGVLEELLACEHDWCGFPYTILGEPRCALGCTKFSASLIRKHPDLMERVGEHSTHWQQQDRMIHRVLAERGYGGIHEHWPPVLHLNPAHVTPPHKCALGHDCDDGGPDGHGCPRYDRRGHLLHGPGYADRPDIDVMLVKA